MNLTFGKCGPVTWNSDVAVMYDGIPWGMISLTNKGWLFYPQPDTKFDIAALNVIADHIKALPLRKTWT